MYCNECLKNCGYTIKKENERYKLFDEFIECEMRVPYCKGCGSQMWVESVEEKNFDSLYGKYRKENYLLSPAQIVEIVKKSGVSYAEFERILGLSAYSISRYESGSIQSKEEDNLIRLARYKKEFEILRAKYEKEKSK